MQKLEIITVKKETLIINDDGTVDVSSKILNRTVKNCSTSLVITTEKKQLCPNEVKYGYIHIEKNSIFRDLFIPGAPIRVSLYGIIKDCHFHSSQSRIDGFTKIFSQIEDLEARVFKVYYDASDNMLVFTEI